MTKLPLLLFWTLLSNWTKKSSVLDTLKFSSELEFLDTWRKFVKIRLDLFFPGFRLVPEARHLACNLRSCKIRNLLFIVAREQLEHTCCPRPGNGSRSGWQLSQILNVLSLESTRKNMRIRLLLLRQTLTKPLLNVMQSSLFMSVFREKNKSFPLLFLLVDLRFRTSLIKPTALRVRKTIFKNKLMKLN